MFFAGKKIVYLNVYNGEKREESVGFAKSLKEKGGYRLEISLRKLQEWSEGSYQVSLEADSKKISLGYVKIKYGEGRGEFFLPVRDGFLKIADGELAISDFYGLVVRGNKDSTVRGRWRMQKKGEDIACVDEIKTEVSVKAMEIRDSETALRQEWVENYAEDKWQQLLKNFPKVHPFGDAREFITIEPKDFIILQSSYQRLVNNSFLLHGFYNYRHMILGFCSGLDRESGCYLGVPGTFYEREKMVAIMFGFEGFECIGPVEDGKFGYYMRKVEI